MAGRIRVAHLLIAGGLVLAASPAFAQDGMLFKNLMEGIMGKGDGGDIDYRARAPLVDAAASAGGGQRAQRRLAERSGCPAPQG